VVDKLLTGFDAPPATYLYIDKQMRDHGLFQAICRVNRLDGDDKDYGYIVDYKDLFKKLEGAVNDYASEALDGFDKEDVAGLLEDRLEKAREKLETCLESMRALCESVEPPKDEAACYRYFSAKDHGNAEQLAANEPQRLALYTLTASLIRAYANIANEMTEAGFSETEAASIKAEVIYFENLRTQIKIHSGDAIDLKQYEPAMRHLIDTYIRAEDSVKVSAFDDMSLIQLIVERGVKAIDALPEGIKNNEQAVAETIENNVRKLILDENPINPKYYEKMSQLLDALIQERKKGALDYKKYLEKIMALTNQVQKGPNSADYPKSLYTPAKKALFDNLYKNEALAITVDNAIRGNLQDDWRNSAIKIRATKLLIKNAIQDFRERGATSGAGGTSYFGEDNDGYMAEDIEGLTTKVLELVKNQNEY
jgi:type I restriction enzyme R subunit